MAEKQTIKLDPIFDTEMYLAGDDEESLKIVAASNAFDNFLSSERPISMVVDNILLQHNLLNLYHFTNNRPVKANVTLERMSNNSSGVTITLTFKEEFRQNPAELANRIDYSCFVETYLPSGDGRWYKEITVDGVKKMYSFKVAQKSENFATNFEDNIMTIKFLWSIKLVDVLPKE